MASHLERIEHVETEVNKLLQTASSKKEVASLRKEYKALMVRSPKVSIYMAVATTSLPRAQTPPSS